MTTPKAVKRGKVPFVRGGFGRVSTNSNKSINGESFFKAATRSLKGGDEVSIFSGNYHSSCVRTSITTTKFDPDQDEIQSPRISALCRPMSRVNKAPEENPAPQTAEIENQCPRYSASKYHSYYVYPRQEGNPFNTPNLAVQSKKEKKSPSGSQSQKDRLTPHSLPRSWEMALNIVKGRSLSPAIAGSDKGKTQAAEQRSEAPASNESVPRAAEENQICESKVQNAIASLKAASPPTPIMKRRSNTAAFSYAPRQIFADPQGRQAFVDRHERNGPADNPRSARTSISPTRNNTIEKIRPDSNCHDDTSLTPEIRALDKLSLSRLGSPSRRSQTPVRTTTPFPNTPIDSPIPYRKNRLRTPSPVKTTSFSTPVPVTTSTVNLSDSCAGQLSVRSSAAMREKSPYSLYEEGVQPGIPSNQLEEVTPRNHSFETPSLKPAQETEIMMPPRETPQCSYSTVVAIDFGTTYSGYAYAFTHDPDNVSIMRKWEGDDPGMNNQKTPTILLLTPEQRFHSFGITARDCYNDLDPREASKWLYFDKFKMILHHNQEINRSTTVVAANGRSVAALTVFSLTLRYFKDHALRELTDATGRSKFESEDARWVITVPAIWRQKSKQFMREAAYMAGIGSPDKPAHVLIALEPEVASINCRKLKMNQLVPERPKSIFASPSLGATKRGVDSMSLCSEFVLEDPSAASGGRYMVVDCGGGTVDITVHEIVNCGNPSDRGQLKEMFKATGGPFGSITVDEAFDNLLDSIFGSEFMGLFRSKRPSGYIDLMIAFESRKRGCGPNKLNPVNIALPFSFIDFHKKHKGKDVGHSIAKYGDRNIKWVSHGMLRIDVDVMRKLFEKPLDKICQQIHNVMNSAHSSGLSIGHLFLVGGFAESAIVQEVVRAEFASKLNVIIPQGASVAVLRGAVLYGLDPSIVHVRRAMKTYGLGVIKPFIHGYHPTEKLSIRCGREWCMDVFDKFVLAGQSVSLGEAVARTYRPVDENNRHIVIHVFSSDRIDSEFITDEDVEMCGSLNLSLDDTDENNSAGVDVEREILAKMSFGDTEIKASAIDLQTKQTVKAYVDFLNESNPKYRTRL